MSATFKLPPAERDFEIYEAVHVAGCSTWSQAEKYGISQTRVRQLIRRVVEWLGQVLPPQAKVAKEQEMHLARQIAADRFQYQLEQATELWNETKEIKYASLRIRLTMAQARLGAVSGTLGGLAADAIEGISVPVWAPDPEGEADREGEAPAEPTSSFIVHPSVPSPPPIEDFSAPADNPPRCPPAPAAVAAGNAAAITACDQNPAPAIAISANGRVPSQPLLTASAPRPITEFRIAPDQPGALVSPVRDAGSHFLAGEEVAVVEVVRRCQQLVADGEIEPPQVAINQRHDFRPVAAGAAKRGQNRRGHFAQEGDRAPLHARAVADAAALKDQDAAGQHVDAGQVADVAANGDHSSPHRMADFISRIAADKNRASGHPLGAAPIGGADEMSRLAAYVNQPAVHFAADPIAGIA
jgi:hypothetical protein